MFDMPMYQQSDAVPSGMFPTEQVMNFTTPRFFQEEEEDFEEEYVSSFTWAPNNPYKMEWRFPNWTDDFIVQYVPCKHHHHHNDGHKHKKNLFERIGHGVKKGGEIVGHGAKKGAKKTGKFVKKHAVAVTVGAVVVVGVAVTIATLGADCGAGTAAGALAAKALSSALEEKDGKPTQSLPKTQNTSQPSSIAIPIPQAQPSLRDTFQAGNSRDSRVGETSIAEIRNSAATITHEIWSNLNKPNLPPSTPPSNGTRPISTESLTAAGREKIDEWYGRQAIHPIQQEKH